MIFLQDITYIHTDKELLFDNINLTVNKHEKIALIGNNGTGKSTLLKIIAGNLRHSSGKLSLDSQAYYLPQIFGQYNHLTIAQALHIENKFKALREILDGKLTEENLHVLNDDWEIEERCNEALKYWQLTGLDLSQTLAKLSGGQKTKIFLAGISIHQPEIILLDEPSNHLDTTGRQLLYDFIRSNSNTMIIVSHDRRLLNLLDTVCELSKVGITSYGGNYDFYTEQKQIENNALNNTIHSKEKTLRKARKKERETLERMNKLDARGRKKQVKSGMPKTMMNKMKNDSEKSSSKTKGIHAEKISGISQELTLLRSTLPDMDKIKFGFNDSALHKGKILIKAENINFNHGSQFIWKENLSFRISSGERIRLQGLNGSGKTTLIKLILGDAEPKTGSLFRAINNPVYIDQDYSLIDDKLKVYEQAELFNTNALQEHEIKIRLNRFLFPKEKWDKQCNTLSGGERMRLILCCLTIHNFAPDLIILDEPTNNLDIQNMDILTAAINEYEGTLIVVSHDDYFLEQIHIQRTIML